MQKYIEERFVMVILAIQVLLIGLGVLSRYGFGWSFSFTEELTRYLLIWLACLGFPVCWARSEMIRFKMPWKKPAWLETFLTWFSLILIALYFAVLMVGAIKMIWMQWQFNQKTSVMGWPIVWVSFSIPCLALLFVLRMVYRKGNNLHK